jgi:DNA polymerase I-like protein with 3'-5' exonuclease and polymerase domains/uracil-DNA glycosylase
VKFVPLYNGWPRAAVQDVEPVPHAPGCQLCALSKNTPRSFVRPKATAGNADKRLLVVGSIAPPETSIGKPAFSTSAELWFSKMLKSIWDGQVVYDYGLRCPSKVFGRRLATTVTASHHSKCRPYTAATFVSYNPTHVICLGNHAAKSFLGYDRGGSAHCNRRGYTFIQHDGRLIPVFIMAEPANVMNNTFMATWFESDLKWALTTPPSPVDFTKYSALKVTNESLAEAERVINSVVDVAFDCETYGKLFNTDFRLLSVAVAFESESEVKSLVWFGDDLEPGSKPQKLLEHILRSPKWNKYGQNVQYDISSILCAYKFLVSPVVGDSRLAFKTINTNADAGLDQMAELIGMGGHKEEAQHYVEIEKRRLRKEFTSQNPDVNSRLFNAGAYAYAAIPEDVNIRYVARDAYTTLLLAKKFETILKEKFPNSLYETYRNLLVPASTVFSKLQKRGIAFDPEPMEATMLFIDNEMSTLASKIRAYKRVDPQDFNPGSADHVADLLYKELRLKPPRGSTTASGKNSVDKATLQKLAATHPAAELILQWRAYNKLKTTYATSLPFKACADGRIRPSFLLDGTKTGRLSATDGLHQIPSRSKEGKFIKQCFRPGRGRKFLQADYSTLEIKIAALLSNDRKMIEVIKSGVDFHLATAMALGPVVWNTPSEKIAELHATGQTQYRTICKTINFGTLYGQSAAQLAENITGMLRAAGVLSESESFRETDAAKAQNAIFGAFPDLRRWIDSQQGVVDRTGEVWTYWNGRKARRRLLTDAGYTDRGDLRSSALRSSYNTPIQGTGSDYCLNSVVSITNGMEDLFGDDAFPVLTVHDSICFDVKDDPEVIAQVVKFVHSVMCGWYSADVPITIDFEIGDSWGDLEKMKVDGSGKIVEQVSK